MSLYSIQVLIQNIVDFKFKAYTIVLNAHFKVN